MRQRRAQHRAAGACGSQTRDRFDFRLHAFSAQLEDQRCHAVDAAVAGADEAHGFSLARQIERQLAAGDLLRHGRLIERLSGVAVLDQIDIDRIPDDGVAGAKRAVGADGHVFKISGADAHNKYLTQSLPPNARWQRRR